MNIFNINPSSLCIFLHILMLLVDYCSLQSYYQKLYKRNYYIHHQHKTPGFSYSYTINHNDNHNIYNKNNQQYPVKNFQQSSSKAFITNPYYNSQRSQSIENRLYPYLEKPFQQLCFKQPSFHRGFYVGRSNDNKHCYYVCPDYNIIPHGQIYYHCCRDGFGFDFVTKTCIKTQSLNPRRPNTFNDNRYNFNNKIYNKKRISYNFDSYNGKCRDGETKPHPYDCRKYYRCLFNLKFVETECPFDFVWNPKYQICDTTYRRQCTNVQQQQFGQRPKISIPLNTDTPSLSMNNRNNNNNNPINPSNRFGIRLKKPATSKSIVQNPIITQQKEKFGNIHCPKKGLKSKVHKPHCDKINGDKNVKTPRKKPFATRTKTKFSSIKNPFSNMTTTTRYPPFIPQSPIFGTKIRTNVNHNFKYDDKTTKKPKFWQRRRHPVTMMTKTIAPTSPVTTTTTPHPVQETKPIYDFQDIIYSTKFDSEEFMTTKQSTIVTTEATTTASADDMTELIEFTTTKPTTPKESTTTETTEVTTAVSIEDTTEFIESTTQQPTTTSESTTTDLESTTTNAESTTTDVESTTTDAEFRPTTFTTTIPLETFESTTATTTDDQFTTAKTTTESEENEFDDETTTTESTEMTDESTTVAPMTTTTMITTINDDIEREDKPTSTPSPTTTLETTTLVTTTLREPLIFEEDSFCYEPTARYKDTEDCQCFYECQFNKRLTRNCCPDGLFFNQLDYEPSVNGTNNGDFNDIYDTTNDSEIEVAYCDLIENVDCKTIIQ